MTSILLDGPPPQVKISDHRRTDLVIAKINLIVDAQKVIPLFLDAKPQKAEIGGRIFTFRFANSLKTVLINEMPFQFEFGGLPRPISVGNKKHFIRFSVLPTGIEPGCVRIINMEEWLTDTRNVPYANPNATPISGANGSQFTNQNKSNMDGKFNLIFFKMNIVQILIFFKFRYSLKCRIVIDGSFDKWVLQYRQQWP